MKYNPDTHHRHSIRLSGYDYSQEGAYFITVCTHNRQLLFEEPALKQIVERAWNALPERFASVSLDEFVTMPNHVHFIVWLNAVEASPVPMLAAVVGAFKSLVATEWLNFVRTNAPDRSARLWQRNYYDHVIRDEDALLKIRQYIRDNPSKWAEDHDNPATWNTLR